MSDYTMVIVFLPSLFLVMLVLLEVGRRLGMRRVASETEQERAGLIAMEAAIFALLGLMLAFTFSGAASRFESRRVMTVDEANAIGTAYLRLDLLPVSAQPALREKFRRYTEARLLVYQVLPDLAASKTHTLQGTVLQQEIWTGAVTALHDSPTAATMLLLPALNQMIDIPTSRAIAARTHTPTLILGTLAILAMVCSFLAGYSLASGSRLSARLHMIGFALVVTATLYVILDLDYPRVGLISLEYADQAFIDVLAGMK